MWKIIGGAPDERSMSVLDSGRSLKVGGGRDKNADGRTMDGGNSTSALPAFIGVYLPLS